MPTIGTTGGPSPRLGEFIRHEREAILAEWEARALALPAARKMGESALRDHVPALLEALAELTESQAEVGIALESLPTLHALGRLEAGFDLPQLAQEYWTLREVVLDLWLAQVGPVVDAREMRQFDRAFERLLDRSISSFTETRERTLLALDRVSAAALGTGELDRFLPELLTAVCQAAPAVDAAAVLLEEQGRLRMRAAVGLDPELARQVTLRLGEGFAGWIAQERRPLGLRDAMNDPRVAPEELASTAIHALFGVPLLLQERLVGVAFMGSQSAYEFGEQDRYTFRAMAQRATSLIVQAQLRAELRRNQQLLQAIFDQAPAALFLKNPDGSYVLTNRVTETLLQRSREELRGRGAEALWPRETAETIRAHEVQVLQSGEPCEFEETLLTPRGPRTFLAVRFPLLDEHGRPWALGGIATDITERKLAQQAQAELLRQTELARAKAESALAELDAVLAAAPVGILFIDRQQFIRRANRRISELSNLEPEQLEGKRAGELIAAENAVEGEQVVREVLETGRPMLGQIVPVRLRAHPETELHLLRNLQPVRAAGGEVIGVVMALVDVSEQVRSNQRLSEALVERQRIADVFERGDACVVTDRDFRILLVNRNQERMSRTRREETLGRNFWELFPPPTAESQFWQGLQRVMQERVEARVEEYYTPLERWFDARVYPTREGGVAVFFSDVTERKRAEQFEERLVAIVSHDLRNPLSAIGLSAKVLLQRHEELPAFAAVAAGRISRGVDRMAEMIGQLLDFTKARLAGGIPLVRRPTELGAVAERVVEELAPLHPGRVRLECEAAAEGEWDPARLAQVLSNLLSNALKHGAPEAQVEIRVGRAGHEAFAVVHNQGPPIAPELMPILFDPFKRGAIRLKGGLGLGLYIAQQIVLGHGGRIEVSSSAEQGTCFTVWLPG